MATRFSAPAYAKPYVPSDVQADGVHRAHHERHFAANTNALWMRHEPTHHSWFWLRPPIAPTCTITAASTWTNFLMDTRELQLPWLFHPNIKRLKFKFWVAAPDASRLPIVFRLQATQMYDAMSNANSPATVELSRMESMNPPSGDWAQYAPTYGYRRIYTYEMTVRPFTVASSNVAAIRLQAQYNPSVYESSVSNTYAIYLMACAARETVGA